MSHNKRPIGRTTERIRQEQGKEPTLLDTIKLELHLVAFAGIKLLVSKMSKEDQLKGEMECILCGDKLYFVQAKSNNHLHIKCSREGCIKAME